jgi:hypothetical protein
MAGAPLAAEGSFLQRFLDATGGMSPAERGAYLEHPPPGAPDLDEAHHVSAPAPSSLHVLPFGCMRPHTARQIPVPAPGWNRAYDVQ